MLLGQIQRTLRGGFSAKPVERLYIEVYESIRATGDLLWHSQQVCISQNRPERGVLLPVARVVNVTLCAQCEQADNSTLRFSVDIGGGNMLGVQLTGRLEAWAERASDYVRIRGGVKKTLERFSGEKTWQDLAYMWEALRLTGQLGRRCDDEMTDYIRGIIRCEERLVAKTIRKLEEARARAINMNAAQTIERLCAVELCEPTIHDNASADNQMVWQAYCKAIVRGDDFTEALNAMRVQEETAGKSLTGRSITGSRYQYALGLAEQSKRLYNKTVGQQHVVVVQTARLISSLSVDGAAIGVLTGLLDSRAADAAVVCGAVPAVVAKWLNGRSNMRTASSGDIDRMGHDLGLVAPGDNLAVYDTVVTLFYDRNRDKTADFSSETRVALETGNVLTDARAALAPVSGLA